MESRSTNDASNHLLIGPLATAVDVLASTAHDQLLPGKSLIWVDEEDNVRLSRFHDPRHVSPVNVIGVYGTAATVADLRDGLTWIQTQRGMTVER